MATVDYKCPNCGGPLSFNPDKQNFSCEYCYSEFDPKKIQEIYAEKEQKETINEREVERTEQARAKGEEGAEENMVSYSCPSCGAEVVTTETTAATMCFYCQSPVVMGGRLSGSFKPDKVIPFALSKDKAIEKFLQMCGKKWFLPKGFASKEQFEKLNGVYFPYWSCDERKIADTVAIGKKIRTWTTGKKHYTETTRYRVYRTADVYIKNVFERALKNNDREMLECVHPFDMNKAQPFAMSYLSGFQAEKRDINKEEIAQSMEQKMRGYAQNLMRETMTEYDSVNIESYRDENKSKIWQYTLLPVWIVTYKYNGQIIPFAINGQTGKTYGVLPVNKGKLAAFSAIIGAVVFILAVLGGMLFI